ncbi:hypothetical protein OROMI_026131 [Orobanche minor]
MRRHKSPRREMRRTRLGLSRVREARPKILWKNLKGEKAAEFKEALTREGDFLRGADANLMWISMANAIRSVGEKVVGVSSGRSSRSREAWWWNEEVQKKVKDKQALFKELLWLGL